jgi:hypothetical protein
MVARQKMVAVPVFPNGVGERIGGREKGRQVVKVQGDRVSHRPIGQERGEVVPEKGEF